MVAHSSVNLETSRLKLRMFSESDLDSYSEMCADPQFTRFLGDGKPLTRPEAWRHLALFLGQWQLRGYGMWAIEDKKTGILLGRVGFIHPEGWPGCELCWALGRPHWGNGFATEAAKAALKWGFNARALKHVISLIHPDNHPSIAVAERIGEVLEDEIELFDRPALIYGARNAESAVVDPHPVAFSSNLG